MQPGTSLKQIGLGAIIVLFSISCTPSSGITSLNVARVTVPLSHAAAAMVTPSPAESEGLLICNFEKDISIWQGYVQDTETVVKTGETPPQGYLNIAKFHSKYTDRWAKPSAGFTLSKEQVKEGESSGKWENTVENNRVVAIDIPHDWTGYKYLTFWAYSAAANKSAIELVAYSEDDKTSDDDYYKFEIVIDWTGWRKFEIPLKEFAATRNPHAARAEWISSI